MARRRKPHDPAAATRELIARREREEEKRRLEAQGATVKTDRTGRIVSAYRSNVFNLLLQRGTITQNHHNAAATLAAEWAAWKGLDGKAEVSPGRVDQADTSKALVTDRMLNAGRRVARTLGSLDIMHSIILEAFMEATVEQDRPMAWRGIMERLGITTRDKQTADVVAALEALRQYYEAPRSQDRVAA